MGRGGREGELLQYAREASYLLLDMGAHIGSTTTAEGKSTLEASDTEAHSGRITLPVWRVRKHIRLKEGQPTGGVTHARWSNHLRRGRAAPRPTDARGNLPR